MKYKLGWEGGLGLVKECVFFFLGSRWGVLKVSERERV